MRLGDKFPPEEKQRYISDRLVPGTIIHCHCSFTSPAKHKFVVLVCCDPCCIVFLINSELSNWLQARADLRDCQVVIQKKDHEFLDRDSYLDCTNAERRLSLEDLVLAVMKDLENLKGNISAREREAINYAVKVCRTLSPKEKELILGALSVQR